MKFEIESMELNKLLKDVCQCISSKPSVPWMRGLYLNAGSDGKLTAIATNGSQTITKSTEECIVAEEGTAVLEDGKLFQGVVSKLSGLCTVESRDGKKASIRAKGSKTSMVLQAEGEFAKPAVLEAKVSFTVQGPELGRALKTVKYAISRADSRTSLTGANICVEEGKMQVVGLDGFRMAVVSIMTADGATEKATMIIPGAVVDSILAVFTGENEVSIESDGRKVTLTDGETTMQASLLAGEYMDYRRILPKQSAIKVKANTRDLREAVARALLMCGKSTLLKFRIDADAISITSNSEIGDSEEKVPCMLEGEPMEIAFNGRYLAEALSNAESEEVLMKMTTSAAPAVMMAANGGYWLHIVLPVRMVGGAE